MARIISSRKKYVPVKDLVVYPSKTETIEVIPDDGFNGAHRYRARMCAGFVNGKTKYVDATDTIQFVHKHEDGTITPGWQSEQLALILLDRVKKLNEKFPWTSAIDDVFKDCFIPTTTYEKGPLQFEIDEQLNTTWYKK